MPYLNRPGFLAILLHNHIGFVLDLGFVLEHTVNDLVCEMVFVGDSRQEEG